MTTPTPETPCTGEAGPPARVPRGAMLQAGGVGRGPALSPPCGSLPSTEYGMYQPRCGLENVLMSWGHDGKDLGGQLGSPLLGAGPFAPMPPFV